MNSIKLNKQYQMLNISVLGIANKFINQDTTNKLGILSNSIYKYMFLGLISVSNLRRVKSR